MPSISFSAHDKTRKTNTHSQPPPFENIQWSIFGTYMPYIGSAKKRFNSNVWLAIQTFVKNEIDLSRLICTVWVTPQFSRTAPHIRIRTSSAKIRTLSVIASITIWVLHRLCRLSTSVSESVESGLTFSLRVGFFVVALSIYDNFLFVCCFVSCFVISLFPSFNFFLYRDPLKSLVLMVAR